MAFPHPSGLDRGSMLPCMTLWDNWGAKHQLELKEERKVKKGIENKSVV